MPRIRAVLLFSARGFGVLAVIKTLRAKQRDYPHIFLLFFPLPFLFAQTPKKEVASWPVKAFGKVWLPGLYDTTRYDTVTRRDKGGTGQLLLLAFLPCTAYHLGT
jgi:hypothetical protein